MDLLESIAVAGGYSSAANLKDIRVSSKADSYSNVYRINLMKQMESASTPRYILQPEDAVIVMERRAGVLGIGMSVLRDAVAVLGSIASILLIADQVKRD